MEEVIYYSELYDLYHNLLTEKQKEYFECYYFDNLSFSEIAENYKVSRNAVYRQLKFTKDLLEDYEEKLLLKRKREEIEQVLDEGVVSKKIRNIIDNN